MPCYLSALTDYANVECIACLWWRHHCYFLEGWLSGSRTLEMSWGPYTVLLGYGTVKIMWIRVASSNSAMNKSHCSLPHSHSGETHPERWIPSLNPCRVGVRAQCFIETIYALKFHLILLSVIPRQFGYSNKNVCWEMKISLSLTNRAKCNSMRNWFLHLLAQANSLYIGGAPLKLGCQATQEGTAPQVRWPDCGVAEEGGAGTLEAGSTKAVFSDSAVTHYPL